MNALLLCIVVYIGFIIAYHTYGRFLGNKLFNLSKKALTPAHEINDGIDYVPTRKKILFGHHFTSIAGTGPIVGPAIGVIWGWVPALIWVFVGSIVMGAVHDMGALVISARNKGKSIGEITSDIVSPTSRLLFLFVIFFCLVIVVSIFAMIINSMNFYTSRNWFLFSVNCIIIIFVIWMILEVFRVIKKASFIQKNLQP